MKRSASTGTHPKAEYVIKPRRLRDFSPTKTVQYHRFHRTLSPIGKAAVFLSESAVGRRIHFSVPAANTRLLISCPLMSCGIGFPKFRSFIDPWQNFWRALRAYFPATLVAVRFTSLSATVVSFSSAALSSSSVFCRVSAMS